MITKFKIFEDKDYSDKRNLLKSIVKFGTDNLYTIDTDLNIWDTVHYDNDNNTEISGLYPEYITYHKYNDESSDIMTGSYDEISDSDIDLLLNAFETNANYLPNFWEDTSFEDAILYKEYIKVLDYVNFRNDEWEHYPDTYEEYLRQKKAKEFNL